MRLAVHAAILLLFLGQAIQARAESLDTTGEAYHHAVEHYAEGAYREALAELTSVYDQIPAPAILHDLALCHEALGELDQAAELYRRALAGDPDAPDREAISRRLALLAGGVRIPLPEMLRGALIVTASHHTSVSLDGRRVGSTPWAGFREGKHAVRLQASGLYDQERTVDVVRGKVTTLAIAISTCACLAEITSTPSDADVTIDTPSGPPEGRTPHYARLSRGKHVVYVAKEGYQTQAVTVDTEKWPTSVDVVLGRELTGFIRVAGPEAANAEVTVDGRPVCAAVPCLVKVPFGDRRLEVHMARHEPAGLVLAVRPSTQTDVTVELAPSRSPVPPYVAAGAAAALLGGGAFVALSGRAASAPAAGLFAGGVAATAVAVFYPAGKPSRARVQTHDLAISPVLGPGFAGIAAAGSL